MLFPKHENVSTACIFTSLRSYVPRPLSGFGGNIREVKDLVREVKGLNLGLVKSSTEFHRCDFSLKGAILPKRNVVVKGPANSLHVWV